MTGSAATLDCGNQTAAWRRTRERAAKENRSLHMTSVESMQICDVTHYPALLLTALDAFAFPTHFPPFSGHCKEHGTTATVPGTSRAECRAGPVFWGAGLETRRNKRLIFLNLGLKLITLFNKRPIPQALVLFNLTFLCLFDLSLTALCTGAYEIRVLSAVQCDRIDQRVLSTIHCSRRLWNGRTWKGNGRRRVGSFRLTVYVKVKCTPELA
jgi:hypothetical protein